MYLTPLCLHQLPLQHRRFAGRLYLAKAAQLASLHPETPFKQRSLEEVLQQERWLRRWWEKKARTFVGSGKDLRRPKYRELHERWMAFKQLDVGEVGALC